MPTNDREKQRAWSKAWYQRNKEKHKEGSSRNRKRAKNRWIEFKESQSCSHCGFSHPAVIDFHHVVRGPLTKKVNQLVQKGSYTKAREEAETNCIPLCSNCHRILHWEEQDAQRELRKAVKKSAHKKAVK